ncbi:unnamed protein product, partial [Rotaria socialis]
TENTIKNCFRAAGFIRSSSTPSSSMTNMDIIVETDIESNNSDNPLQQLHSLLVHRRIGGSQLTAAEFVDIDSDDNEEEEEEEEEEEALLEQPPNLYEALEIMRKLHLFASIEQPLLHNLISDLESQLTDIYLDSKAVK